MMYSPSGDTFCRHNKASKLSSLTAEGEHAFKEKILDTELPLFSRIRPWDEIYSQRISYQICDDTATMSEELNRLIRFFGCGCWKDKHNPEFVRKQKPFAVLRETHSCDFLRETSEANASSTSVSFSDSSALTRKRKLWVYILSSHISYTAIWV